LHLLLLLLLCCCFICPLFLFGFAVSETTSDIIDAKPGTKQLLELNSLTVKK
jgi:amino acid permease